MPVDKDGGGPPNKVTFLDTTNLSYQQTANQLSQLWQQGYTGPYVTVGEVIYIAGYSER